MDKDIINSEEKEKLRYFCKIGIIVLSILVIVFAGVRFIPKIITADNSNMKKSSVYCVDQRGLNAIENPEIFVFNTL